MWIIRKMSHLVSKRQCKYFHKRRCRLRSCHSCCVEVFAEEACVRTSFYVVWLSGIYVSCHTVLILKMKCVVKFTYCSCRDAGDVSQTLLISKSCLVRVSVYFATFRWSLCSTILRTMDETASRTKNSKNASRASESVMTTYTKTF